MTTTELMRPVPGTSVVHRLWAGTKIVAALAFSLVLLAGSTWWSMALLAGFLLTVALLAHVPPGALPRLPRWFWIVMVGTGGYYFAATGTSGLLRYLQLTSFAALLILGGLVIGWTTPTDEIAPAMATLAAPLRKLRLPADEWVVTVALCLRSLPLLIEEIRVLRAARRLRPKTPLSAQLPHQRHGDTMLVDIITATMAVALRRAGELGEAITARGGAGQLTAAPSRPGRADAVAMLVVLAVCTATLYVGLQY